MNDFRNGLPIARWLPDRPSPAEVEELLTFLNDAGTFRFPTVASGLFSAAAGDDPQFRLTGYQNVWVRDNCHIAHALWKIGQTSEAVRATTALLDFYARHKTRIVQIVAGDLDPSDPQNRPHVRFDGDRLEELPVHWSHAQNDALGAVIWLACKLARAGDLRLSADHREVLRLLTHYLNTIEFWQDEDSGHWEETRKIEASSIGVVVAGLRELQEWQEESRVQVVEPELLANLLQKGEEALSEILPAECIQKDPRQHRRYDSALLFLVFPFGVVDDAMAARILTDVREHLTGPIGIRRYIGDSYWCADYRDLLAPEVRTTDFSDDTSGRDKLLRPGEEAQWCLFDPLISVIHGNRFLESRREEERELQVHHLRRSLAQLTTSESRFPPYRCPESYFLEHGEWIPNDITPLLWTQAHLRLALEGMIRVARETG